MISAATNLTILLLACAVQAQQELSVAQHLAYNMERRFGEAGGELIPVKHQEGRLPPGYSYPRNPRHDYYDQYDGYGRDSHPYDYHSLAVEHHHYPDEHPYQYHPFFSENEMAQAASTTAKQPTRQGQQQFPSSSQALPQKQAKESTTPGPSPPLSTERRRDERDVLPTDPRYRGFGAPYTPYMPSPYAALPSPMTSMYGYGPSSYMMPSSMGRGIPGAYPPPTQMTRPYAQQPAKILTGFDVYGRPIYSHPKPQPEQKAGAKGQVQPSGGKSSAGQPQRASGYQVDQQQPRGASQLPASAAGPPLSQSQQEQQQQQARTLGLYAPPINPFYDAYMEKQAAKMWYKQQKRMAKYGPQSPYGQAFYSQYGEYSPLSMQATMPGDYQVPMPQYMPQAQASPYYQQKPQQGQQQPATGQKPPQLMKKNGMTEYEKGEFATLDWDTTKSIVPQTSAAPASSEELQTRTLFKSAKPKIMQEEIAEPEMIIGPERTWAEVQAARQALKERKQKKEDKELVESSQFNLHPGAVDRYESYQHESEQSHHFSFLQSNDAFEKPQLHLHEPVEFITRPADALHRATTLMDQEYDRTIEELDHERSDHERALRYGQKQQMYGEYYEPHAGLHQQPWLQGQAPLPLHAQHHAAAEDLHFHDKFSQIERSDQDILAQHGQDAAQELIRFEDPHYHAPMTRLGGHLQDPFSIRGDERRPIDSDFYNFEWKKGHDAKHYAIEEGHPVYAQPLGTPTVTATDLQRRSPKQLARAQAQPFDLKASVKQEAKVEKAQDAKKLVDKKTEQQEMKKKESLGQKVGERKTNETPMYVRPYLEDPIFLQPDDGEVSQLHPGLVNKQGMDKTHHATAAQRHDLHTDDDLGPLLGGLWSLQI